MGSSHAIAWLIKSTRKWKKYLQLIPFLHWRQQPIAAAEAVNGELAIYYLLNLKPTMINLKRLSKPIHAYWFDPTDGNTIPIADTSLSDSNHYLFKPPSKNAANESDWVLIIRNMPTETTISPK
jgi:hypothetical protein